MTPTEEEQQRDENQQQSERKPAGEQTATRLIKTRTPSATVWFQVRSWAEEIIRRN